MRADVWGVNRDNDVLENHWRQFGQATNSVFSAHDTVEKHVLMADLVICGVLVSGAATLRSISADMAKAMKPGAVLLEVAIGQGVCSETSRTTTHVDSTHVVHDVVHYCVAKRPGGLRVHQRLRSKMGPCLQCWHRPTMATQKHSRMIHSCAQGSMFTPVPSTAQNLRRP